MPRLAFSLEVQNWRQLKDAIQRLIEESPESAQHLAPMREDLEQALEETQARRGRLMTLKAETRLETRLLRESTARGKALESRLRSALKALHGPASPKLVRYGIKPLPGPKHPPPAGPEGEPAGAGTPRSGDQASDLGPVDAAVAPVPESGPASDEAAAPASGPPGGNGHGSSRTR